MTDYKEYDRGPKHRSLYIGLLYSIGRGVLLALALWGIISLTSYYVIDTYYVKPDRQEERREHYLGDLQTYVINNNVTLESSDKIGGWVRDNPYVYLLVYQSPEENPPTVYSSRGEIAPGEKDKLIEHSGSRIDEDLRRDELIEAAIDNGYYKISLIDGSVVVAINEYTENLYYSTFNFISILAGIFVFVFVLLRYIRVVIERVKRFESDVTIVSEIDMNYEIVSEGADEIYALSKKVETMRRRMLDNIKSEQETRAANTELITSISHDIRTPLTVLMGYIEMMKEHGGHDEVMENYIAATESTALRLKNLSDDMFKYSLAFGDTEKSVKLEEYDLITLCEQLFSEHFVLMREQGYDVRVEMGVDQIREGTTVRTDAPNIMRIVDNVFSNMVKYADPAYPITFKIMPDGKIMTLECKNKILKDTRGAESNGIGLKTCVRLGSLVAKKFEYKKEDEYFICRLIMDINPPT